MEDGKFLNGGKAYEITISGGGKQTLINGQR